MPVLSTGQCFRGLAPQGDMLCGAQDGHGRTAPCNAVFPRTMRSLSVTLGSYFVPLFELIRTPTPEPAGLEVEAIRDNQTIRFLLTSQAIDTVDEAWAPAENASAPTECVS